MKVLIVDDEALARTRLKRLLSAFKDIEVVGEATHGVEALEFIEALRPDAVFLDIEMPELDGFGVAEALRAKNVHIVFVTAYYDRALKAFEVSAVDYVVKPVSEQRLTAAIEKLRKNVSGGFDYNKLAGLLSEPPSARRLAIRCGSRYVVLDPSKISAILSEDHYASIRSEGRELLADDSLDLLLERLKSQQFLRVHRSAVINLDFLKELEREGDRKYFAVLSDPAKTRVPVSRERWNDLRLKLGID